MRIRYIVPAVLLALVAVAGASGAALQRDAGSLHATLTGRVEVPKGDPDGTGTAEVKINGTKVCWEITATKVVKLTAAHIHKGKPGVAGPVVVPFGKTFKAKGCTTTTAAVAAAIKKSPRAYYVNVHNARYPAGALRGQLHS
jgi:CHRD domain